MFRPSAIRSMLIVLAASVLPVRPAAAAWPHDPLQNVNIAPTGANQTYPSMVPDGAGGAYVAFMDYRGANNDIYVQHLTASGAIAPGWPAAGLAVCTAAGDQSYPACVADGAGGVIVTWMDGRAGSANRDIFVQRVLAGASIAPGWPVNGRQLTSNTHDEIAPVIVSDGARGAFVFWTLSFTSFTDYDVYGARVDSSGAVAFSGPVSAPLGIQDQPEAASDGSGGAIVTYVDNQSGNYDIKAIRIAANGSLIYGPVAVCSASGDQSVPMIAGDGAGNAIIAWTDTRAGNADIYASGITWSGAPAIGWDYDGTAICSDPSNQYLERIVPDGAGGAHVSWTDTRAGNYDFYLQHLTVAGAPYPGLPLGGISLTNDPKTQQLRDLVPQAGGGVLAVWLDSRSGHSDVFAMRVTSSGARETGWNYSGNPVCIATSDQGYAIACSDGAGGAILAWQDPRNFYSNIYAQQIDAYGVLGGAQPSISKVRDVLADQGGHVRLDWSASWLDTPPTPAISQYWVWRQAPAAQAALASGQGALIADEAGLDELARGGPAALNNAAAHGLYMTTSAGAASYAWEFVAAQPTSGFPSYSLVVNTTTDSTAGHNYYTVFMVQARSSQGAFWNSAPDSGYSTDNLPPIAPAPFTGTYAGGTAHLHWNPNTESDLAGYRLYRGASSGFTPSPANRVAELPDTGYADPAGAPWVYKLSAVDVHGNESAFATYVPSGTTGIGEGPALEFALAPIAPNPARGALAFQITLPRAALVELAITDAAGRRVASVAASSLEAGAHTLGWSGRGDDGRPLASGLYFAELRAGNEHRVRRFALVR